jgi:TetR/AcrR family transcriptional repressor of mexJK operon
MTDDRDTQRETNQITKGDKSVPLARLGRPTDLAKEAAILKAARQSFLELPYDRVSMDAIAERAGVSKVTLYAKYKSKDGLFVAAMTESCDAIYNQARTDIEIGGPIRDTLLLLGTRFMMMILDPEVAAMHAVMMQISHSRPELPRQFYESSVDRSIETLAETLAIADQRGTLACPNPRQAAVQFVAMVQGVFRYQLELGVSEGITQTAVSAYVASCVDLFLLGYGIRQSV